MSGTALKNTQTNRVSSQDHQRIAASVRQELRTQAFSRIEALPSYKQKADFGNLSVFLQGEARGMSETQAKALSTLFNSPEFVVNDNRVSIAVQGLQVDLSIYGEDPFSTCLAYHSYNTLGGLIGQLAASVGLTLHEDALVYKMIDGSEQLDVITLSTDWATTLRVLGLDAQRWSHGFDTLAAMFLYVASSPLFQPRHSINVLTLHLKTARRKLLRSFFSPEISPASVSQFSNRLRLQPARGPRGLRLRAISSILWATKPTQAALASGKRSRPGAQTSVGT